MTRSTAFAASILRERRRVGRFLSGMGHSPVSAGLFLIRALIDLPDHAQATEGGLAVGEVFKQGWKITVLVFGHLLLVSFCRALKVCPQITPHLIARLDATWINQQTRALQYLIGFQHGVNSFPSSLAVVGQIADHPCLCKGVLPGGLAGGIAGRLAHVRVHDARHLHPAVVGFDLLDRVPHVYRAIGTLQLVDNAPVIVGVNLHPQQAVRLAGMRVQQHDNGVRGFCRAGLDVAEGEYTGTVAHRARARRLAHRHLLAAEAPVAGGLGEGGVDTIAQADGRAIDAGLPLREGHLLGPLTYGVLVEVGVVRGVEREPLHVLVASLRLLVNLVEYPVHRYGRVIRPRHGQHECAIDAHHPRAVLAPDVVARRFIVQDEVEVAAGKVAGVLIVAHELDHRLALDAVGLVGVAVQDAQDTPTIIPRLGPVALDEAAFWYPAEVATHPAWSIYASPRVPLQFF